MTFSLDGRASTKSHLERDSNVESPRETMSVYLKKSDLGRSKSPKTPREDGCSSTRMQRKGSCNSQRVPKIDEEVAEEPLHHRVHDLRMEDRSLGTELLRESRPRTINGKPAPNFQKISGCRVPRRGEETYPRPQPPKLVRPNSLLYSLREEQEYDVPVVAPSFDKPISSLAEKSLGGRRYTIQQLLELKTIEAPPSLKVSMKTPAQPPMTRSPDSAKSGIGMTSQEDSKGKGKAIDEDSHVAYVHNTYYGSDSAGAEQQTEEVERGRSRARIERAKSAPITRSDSWSLVRGRRSVRSSFDDARTQKSNASTGGRVRVYLKTIGNEIEVEDGGRLSKIYEDEEELREKTLDGHLDKIIGELSRRPRPRTTDELYVDRLLNPEINKWINQGVPVRLHDVHELKYVSAVQWTPECVPMMTGAITEDGGDAQLTFKEKAKVQWNRLARRFQRRDDPCVYD